MPVRLGAERGRRAAARQSRTSFTPAETAERGTNAFFEASATRRASVVLPVPGGPKKIADDSRSDSMRRRSARARARGDARWPTTSSRAPRGRIPSRERRPRRGARTPPPRRTGRRDARRPVVLSPPPARGRGWLDEANTEFGELARSDRQRPTGHQVGAGLGLRERDDLSDVVLARQHRDEAIEPDGKPAVRRGAVTQCAEQEAEARFGLFVRDAEGPEHRALHVGTVDADAPRTELPTVEHEVVALGPYPQRIRIEKRKVRRLRHREGMVRGDEDTLVVSNPPRRAESPRSSRTAKVPLTPEADRYRCAAGRAPRRPSGARPRRRGRGRRGSSSRLFRARMPLRSADRKELRHRRVEIRSALAEHGAHPHEALRAEGLCPFDEGVETRLLPRPAPPGRRRWPARRGP